MIKKIFQPDTPNVCHAWYINSDYNPFSWVLADGALYISKKYVPKGTAITDSDYWVAVGGNGSGSGSGSGSDESTQVQEKTNNIEIFINAIPKARTFKDGTTGFTLYQDVSTLYLNGELVNVADLPEKVTAETLTVTVINTNSSSDNDLVFDTGYVTAGNYDNVFNLKTCTAHRFRPMSNSVINVPIISATFSSNSNNTDVYMGTMKISFLLQKSTPQVNVRLTAKLNDFSY